MKKLLIGFLFLLSYCLQAQVGNVGINTMIPGSTLEINGSLSAQYRLTSANYNMSITDYYVAYNGSAAGTITLPAAVAAYPAQGNIKGRVYYIKNTGTSTVAVTANGSELIDNQTGLPVSSIGLGQGWFVMLISNGAAGGVTTWEAIVTNPTSSINTIIGMSTNSTYNLPSTANFNSGIPQVLPFTAGEVQINQGSTATWDAVNNRFIINETGIYELDALSYFGAGGTTGTSSNIGVNLGIAKNGTALANVIAGTRANIGQVVAGAGNTPISFHCLVNLTAGDVIHLTMYRGAFDSATGTVQSQAPAGVSESRHFSLKKL
ncbi:hypothetical protein ACP3T3_21665 [Chryseobacterium sp. CBSDS_008]|uniref:hypothetical protein n=1 Tax=Chryseobacterium sp. CBSDS_008 TaxID=3415265 RepID=UPI003CEAE984